MIISLNNINRLVTVMETQYVFCEEGKKSNSVPGKQLVCSGLHVKGEENCKSDVPEIRTRYEPVT